MHEINKYQLHSETFKGQPNYKVIRKQVIVSRYTL